MEPVRPIAAPDIESYLHDLLPTRDPAALEMEAYAREPDFPIIGPLTGRFCYVLTDNLLWNGKVVGDHSGAETSAIREYNNRIHSDARRLRTIVPIRDGLGLSYRLDV